MEASAADEDGEEGGGGGEEVSEVLEAEDIEELGGAEGEISSQIIFIWRDQLSRNSSFMA